MNRPQPHLQPYHPCPQRGAQSLGSRPRGLCHRRLNRCRLMRARWWLDPRVARPPGGVRGVLSEGMLGAAHPAWMQPTVEHPATVPVPLFLKQCFFFSLTLNMLQHIM